MFASCLQRAAFFVPRPGRLTPIRLGAVLTRLALTVTGLLFLGVGVIGIYLPGVPTTGPVLLSLYLLAKGNPSLQRRVRRLRFLQPYVAYFDGRKAITPRVRCLATAAMWTSITVSCGLFSLSDRLRWSGIIACCVGGVVGTVVIGCYGRSRRPNGQPGGALSAAAEVTPATPFEVQRQVPRRKLDEKRHGEAARSVV